MCELNASATLTCAALTLELAGVDGFELLKPVRCSGCGIAVCVS